MTQLELSTSFVDQVQDILEHLHDFAYLLGHPFAQTLQRAMDHPGESSAQQLRREVLQAIESLSPAPSVSFRAPHARLYNVIHLHYIEGMTVQEAAYELNISVRQAYRDLRRGEEGVAAALWTRLPSVSGADESQRERDVGTSLQDEVQRMDGRVSAVDVCQLLKRAKQAVDRLAIARSVTFELQLPPNPVVVVTDAVVAQQILVSEMSQAIQDAQPGQLNLSLVEQPKIAVLVLRYVAQRDTEALRHADDVISRLAGRLRWSMTKSVSYDGVHSVTLSIPLGGPTILVIDDNEGLIELFDRYLAGLPCRVLQANSGREGLALAQQLKPDAVVLDVMMPEIDGWQVLQTLQTLPATNNDPQLAASLGAAHYLPKPFSRQDLRAVLRHLGVI